MAPIRIGIQIEPNDSFWVQVQEVLLHSNEPLEDVDLVPIEVSDPLTTILLDEQGGLVEDVLAQNLKALICKDILPFQFPSILNRGLPIVYLAETDFQHPLFASPLGLQETARLVAGYLAKKLHGTGYILCAGGLTESNADDGSSRLTGFRDALSQCPDITYDHIPTAWNYSNANAQIHAHLAAGAARPIDAIFGLSDTIALAARDAVDHLGLLHDGVLIAGINGDPLALAAVADGRMTLTVETPASEFARKALELAVRAAGGQAIPPHFSYEPHLITRANVDAIALQKLVAIADMPSRMVGVNRRQEQNRLVQLETSAEISRHVGALLDRETLLSEVSHLIRSNYQYDEVQVFFWADDEGCFVRVLPGETQGETQIDVADSPVLSEVIRTGTPVFIPDMQASSRFAPEPLWPETRSRMTLPVQLGDRMIGILDLHCHKPTLHLRHELIGLQSLANQLGVVMRNADLYAEALEAKARAERADQLKTRLLANVSHELRTPLNVIIGYAQTALSEPNPYSMDLPPMLRRDLGYIAQSGQHLLHLINDLIILSQAEIGALELQKETLAIRPFLEEVFGTMSTLMSASPIAWQIRLPDDLPIVEVDPVRLRQILLNLLHNASKFTSRGEIELGADVVLPYLHLWVRDTGIGIPTDMQDRIFDPFVKMEQQKQRQIGVGLGLTIARRLAVLHGGSITLESQVEQGSTFHIYLPLPDVSGGALPMPASGADPVLLLISRAETPTPAISALCRRQKLTIVRLRAGDHINALLARVRPAGLACDLSAATPDEWQLLERLRLHPQLCQLPLIVYADDTGQPAGITDVLTKPVSDKTLIEVLTALYPRDAQQPVLLVDDDPNARALYQDLVRQALPGHEIQTAENGAVALELMRGRVPALVILDLLMPDVDGFAVLEKMRADPATRHVPVVVMSGRLLTQEDVSRLDYRQVFFHSKNLLSEEEAAAAIQKALGMADGLPQVTSRLVKQALAHIHQNYAEPTFSRDDVARVIGTSKQHLDRIFSKEVGLSVIECLNRFRIERAKQLLDETSDDLTSIAMQVGFNDSAYFSRVFRKLVGQAPSAYRRVPPTRRP